MDLDLARHGQWTRSNDWCRAMPLELETEIAPFNQDIKVDSDLSWNKNGSNVLYEIIWNYMTLYELIWNYMKWYESMMVQTYYIHHYSSLFIYFLFTDGDLVWLKQGAGVWCLSEKSPWQVLETCYDSILDSNTKQEAWPIQSFIDVIPSGYD